MPPPLAAARAQAAPIESTRRLLFRLCLSFKALLSVLEIVAGVLGFVLSQHAIVRFVTVLTQDELTRNLDDWFAQSLRQAAEDLSIGSQRFAALYLLSHGIVKTTLIVGLLRQRLAYYPLSILAFGLFVVYQLFRFQTTHSMWLLILTAVDIVIIAMTVQEYRYLRQRSQPMAGLNAL
ncbi:MAG TPA: DUF2127 domain-containing protein [Casimicrobiaceae bacterium]|nr:DUF2127 domain-containing protein [Casimicrobiaceae bacterium]